ncbi:MAG: ABC transporter permease [Acidobacteriota bacterium]
MKSRQPFKRDFRFLKGAFTRALLALLFIFALGLVFNADGTFFRWDTHRDMLRQISTYGILASGLTVVIVAGGIDLSVGSVLGLSAVCVSLLSIHQGWPAGLALPACLAMGLACGAVAGGFIGRFAIQPFIATLATMVFVRGLSKWVSGGQKVSTTVLGPAGTFEQAPIPPVFELLSARLLNQNLAAVTVVFLTCILVCWVLLAGTRWGRWLYAIGGNELSARLSGVPVTGMKLLAYGLSGLLAAVAGICQAAQEMQGDPEAGMGYELTAIAIVVMGGTSLSGGRGGIGLTLLGTVTIGYLEKILSINAVSEASRLMMTGAIVLTAVLFQRRQR